MFQNAITQSTKYDFQKEILQGLDSFQPNLHMERDQSASASEIETLFLLKTTKLGYDDLARKLQRSTFYVRNCLSKYRKLAKKQTKKRKFEGARSKRVGDDLTIDEINQYCRKNKNKPLTI